jgi:hypothetical protein
LSKELSEINPSRSNRFKEARETPALLARSRCGRFNASLRALNLLAIPASTSAAVRKSNANILTSSKHYTLQESLYTLLKCAMTVAFFDPNPLHTSFVPLENQRSRARFSVSLIASSHLVIGPGIFEPKQVLVFGENLT